MKILIVSQYFWPENFIINGLATELKIKGHDVAVLTGLPNYPEGNYFKGYHFFKGPWTESYQNIDVMRVPLFPRKKGFFYLTLNYISFIISGSFFSLFHRTRGYDLIFCFAPSPATSCLPAVFLKWLTKKPLVFWVQDLWPESVHAVKAVNSEFLSNSIGYVVQFIYKNCDLILMQSKAFKTSLIKWGGRDEQIRYLPNWAEPFPDLNNTPLWVQTLPQGFLIGFAGNIGQAQDMKTIVAAAEILKNNQDIKWVIVGDGSDKAWLDNEVKNRNLQNCIFTVGRKPYSEMYPFFKKADALLVSLTNEDIFSLTIPAKVQAYLSAGCPILASISGEGARVVNDAGAGLSCDAQNPDKLAEIVLQMKNKTIDEKKQMGQNAMKYFNEHFEKSKVVKELETLFLEQIQKMKDQTK